MKLIHLPSRSSWSRSIREGYSSNLVDTSYAAQGVIETVTPCDIADDDNISVGIISKDWPTWATPFSHIRCTLVWILTYNSDLVTPIRRCFPTTLVLHVEDADPTRLTAVDILGFNGPIDVSHHPPALGSLIFFDWNIK